MCARVGANIATSPIIVPYCAFWPSQKATKVFRVKISSCPPDQTFCVPARRTRRPFQSARSSCRWRRPRIPRGESCTSHNPRYRCSWWKDPLSPWLSSLHSRIPTSRALHIDRSPTKSHLKRSKAKATCARTVRDTICCRRRRLYQQVSFSHSL